MRTVGGGDRELVESKKSQGGKGRSCDWLSLRVWCGSCGVSVRCCYGEAMRGRSEKTRVGMRRRSRRAASGELLSLTWSEFSNS